MQHVRRALLILCLGFVALGAGGESWAAQRSHVVPHPRPAPARAAALPVVPMPQLLVDMQTGDVLFAHDAGVPWHPASLTKLMTAYVTFQAIAERRVTLDTRVTMSRKAVNEQPARSGLMAGDTLSLRDALYVLLVKSANDMAVAIAETVDGSTDAFAAEMNETAARLGLTRTHYDNVNGLPDDGQVTTARDLAVLAIDLRRTFPQYDDIFRTQRVALGKTNLRNDNNLLARFEGTTGMKTGFICASGLNLVATAERGGRQLLAVVLGGVSARERDQMTARLLLRGFAGEFTDTGSSVVNIANIAAPPVDMKPLICGRQAKAFVGARLRQFTMGLKGQPNYLADKVAGGTYVVTGLVAARDARSGASDAGAGLAEGDGPGPDEDAAAPPVVPAMPPRK